MKNKFIRAVSMMSAAIMMFSVMSTGFSAAETAEDNEIQIVATGAASPVITAMDSSSEGVVIRWNAIEGVPAFRIYRWYDDGRGWVKLQDTDQLSYTDTSVVSGTSYQYRLVGVSTSGSVMTPTVSKTVSYYLPSQILDTQTVSNGIRISWNVGESVSKVALYRKVENGWKRIATTADSSFTDTGISYGNSYTYTIRELDADGEFLFEEYDRVGVTVPFLRTPSISVSNDAGGVRISWNRIEGAESYRIFYKNSKGSWTRMATTDETSYLDEDVSSGHTYTYTVRCVAQDGETYTSYFDTSGKSVYYIAAPELIAAQGTDDGIRISWKKSDGAAKYRVFYLNSAGNWARLGDTTSTSMLDEEVRSGVTYTYTVRCMNSAGDYISSFYREGIKGMYLSAPDFTVSNGADGIDIQWDAVSGAVNYRVYYYGSKGWTKLTDTTETSLTDTDVVSGTSYMYTVRCINAEGNAFTSGYRDGKRVSYVAAPAITSLKGTEEGVNITWDAVKGAQLYRVYVRGNNGWSRITDTTETSYLDKNVSSGNTYTYTVRCLNSAADTFLSYFKPGVSYSFISAPDFKLTRNEKTITVSWDKVEGAELYRVYHRTQNGWEKIIDTTDTAYEDTSVVSGVTYTYTVRCLNADATAFTSDFLPGKSMKIVDTPYVSSVENTTEGVEVRWGAVAGADKYRVYYKSDNGWTNIGETTDSKFVHANAESGKTYTYTVRCVNAAGTAFESSFDSTGKTIRYIAAPTNLQANSYNNSIRISWKHSEGAEKYRVYYYGSRGWTRLTETTSTSVIDSDVASGYTYRYTVRCITTDGKSFTSDCETPGVSCKFTVMPVLKAPDYTKDGVEISWKASPGAEKYRVYVRGDNGWVRFAETTGTSVENKDLSSGQTYRFTVRCITADGKSFTSDCDGQGVSIYYVASPKLVSTDTDSDSATITWNKPRGAAYYRVYKRVSGSWKRLTTTSSNSYTDYDVDVGDTYSYTVRVISEDGSTFYSGFDPDGFIVTVIASDPVSSGFVYYDQGQYSYPYGDDTIAYSGCGPTCFAMIASTLTGKSITPIDAVKWCGNSYYIYNVGTMWSYFSDAADRFGISMEKQLGKNDFDKVIAALKQGKYVISAQSAGRFTSGGHFIVLAGITSSGRIIVYDPNGGNHYVGTDFAPSEITAAGTQYWIFDK